MLKTGLVSVTFRKKTADDVISLAVAAGLDGIEWGGDVHAPPTDVENARRVGEATRAAGLAVAAYGSYYRTCTYGDGWETEFMRVLNTAEALGAPMIRLWAGDKEYDPHDMRQLESVAAETQALADMAAEKGVRLSYEYHGGTMTNNADGAAALMSAVAHPNCGLYWQPAVRTGYETRADSLLRLKKYVTNLHVFQWADDGARMSLADGEADWTRYLRTANDGTERFAMLEFVKDDAESAFYDDAAALRRWISAL